MANRDWDDSFSYNALQICCGRPDAFSRIFCRSQSALNTALLTVPNERGNRRSIIVETETSFWVMSAIPGVAIASKFI